MMASMLLEGLTRLERRAPVQESLPEFYFQASETETAAKIGAARRLLGDRVVILGHHYQRDEIIQWADYTGDSYKLSVLASQRKEADYILFCGVHFMAESADILSQPNQVVILPNMTAGCSMADMADIGQVEDCWEQLAQVIDEKIVPITYMNSAANLKAFVGERDGAVCTSTNARGVMEWGFAQAPRLLFFPDQHLGRNTGVKMGIPLEEMVVWDPWAELGGNTEESIRRAKVILWKGHCSVHGRFKLEQVRQARAMYPEIKVIVHPECTLDVVQAADCDGSTEYIIKTIEASPPGSQWAVATEINLVNRLAKQHPEQRIFCLDPIVCPCSTMYRIHPAYLRWVLDNLLDGRVVNRIQVSDRIAHWARVALDRMLAIAR
jgi:quinolinate synthase